MSEPITTFQGKALVFNNGVVDVQQNGQSLVNEDKIAVIPQGNVDIDNLTIIKNADNKLEVPIDNDTIYVDQDGFMKAKGGSGGSVVWGNIGGTITNQEDLTTTILGGDNLSLQRAKTYTDGKIDTLEVVVDGKQDKLTAGENITIYSNVISATDTTYTAGNGIDIDANNVISATGGGGGSSYTAGQGIAITDNVIKATSPFLSISTTSDTTSGTFEVTTDSSANPPKFTFPTDRMYAFLSDLIGTNSTSNALLTLDTNLGDLYFRGVIVSVRSTGYFYGVEDGWFPVSKLGVNKPNMLAMYIPNDETVRSNAALEFRHGTVTSISGITLELEQSNRISTGGFNNTSSNEPSYFIFNGGWTYPIKLKWMLDAIFADKFLNGDRGK